MLGGVIGFGRAYLAAWITEHLLFDLRNGLFVHLQTLPLEFFERSRLGDTVTRVTDDIDELGEFLATGLAEGMYPCLKIVFFVGALFYLDARLAVISLVVAPPFWFVGRRFATRVKALAREQRARDGAVTAIVEESLGNAPAGPGLQRPGRGRRRICAGNAVGHGDPARVGAAPRRLRAARRSDRSRRHADRDRRRRASIWRRAASRWAGCSPFSPT